MVVGLDGIERVLKINSKDNTIKAFLECNSWAAPRRENESYVKDGLVDYYSIINPDSFIPDVKHFFNKLPKYTLGELECMCESYDYDLKVYVRSE